MSRRPAPGIATATAAVVAAALWVAVGLPGLPEGDQPTPDVPAAVDAPAAPAGYTREAFGDGWADLDGDGCDTRDEILYRDTQTASTSTGQVQDPPTCIEVAVAWFTEPYTGREAHLTTDTRSDFHVDHVVPLSYAWDHGASTWTPDERVAFSNDPANLLLVDGRLNMSKGDSGPAEWAPPNEAFHCPYAQAWEQVTTTYQLTVTPADEAWIEGACP